MKQKKAAKQAKNNKLVQQMALDAAANRPVRAPKGCCREYCSGCPWTIFQLSGGRRSKRK
jgi:hypothetical protein